MRRFARCFLRQQLVFFGLLMYATKEAIIRKRARKRELEPTISSWISVPMASFDRFVNRAKDEYGIRYIRSMPSSIKELQQNNNLLIKYTNPDGSFTEEEFDMVVLSVGSDAAKEAKNFPPASASSSKNTVSAKRGLKIPSRHRVPACLSAAPLLARKAFRKRSWRLRLRRVCRRDAGR